MVGRKRIKEEVKRITVIFPLSLYQKLQLIKEYYGLSDDSSTIRLLVNKYYRILKKIESKKKNL